MNMQFTILKIATIFLALQFATGCLPSSYIKNKNSLKALRMGPARVIFTNPNEGLTRHVSIFIGCEKVRLIREPKTGKLVFERPPMAEFVINATGSSGNWHSYAEIYLPKNTRFIAIDQPHGFWGYGKPNTIRFSTGSDPFRITCRPVTPTMNTVYASSACISLPYVDGNPVKQLNIRMQVNPGMYIKQGINYLINKLHE